MLKWKQVQGSLYSFFGGKLLSDDKEINTESETPALTRRHGRINIKWLKIDRQENKMFCFVENSRNEKHEILPEDLKKKTI